MSDPLLTDCPECGQSTYVKQVTAAGFQLKGTGWYVTDFRDGGKKPSETSSPGSSGASSETSGSSDSSSSSTAKSSDASSAPAPTAAS